MSSRKAERRRQAALDAESDGEDGLFTRARGKQSGNRRGGKTTTFIMRNLVPHNTEASGRGEASHNAAQPAESSSASHSARSAGGKPPAEATVEAAAASQAPGLTAEGVSPAVDADPAADASSAPQYDGLWDAVPPDCKRLVYQWLSHRDMARAACAGRCFAEDARARRAAVKSIDLPLGLSSDAACSMVAAFAHAGTVSLSRCLLGWRAKLVWTGQAGSRPAAASHLSPEAIVLSILEGVAAGSAARPSRGGSPVQMLNLSNTAILQDRHVHYVCRAFPSLRAIKLDRCTDLTDGALTALSDYTRGGQLGKAGDVAKAEPPRVAIGRPGLEEVSVAGCSSITPLGFQTLLHHGASSRSLAELDVSHTRGIPVALNPRGALQRLRAVDCRGVSRLAIQLPAESPLRDVDVAACHHLSRATVSVDGLQRLNMGQCPSLSTLKLSCGHLRTLQLPHCQYLQVLDVSAVSCVRLEELDLSSCHNLPQAAYTGLQTLPALRRVALGHLLRLKELRFDDTQQQLQTLEVPGCKMLTALHVPSRALNTLDAANCQRLEDIHLNAQHMMELDLSGCLHLARLSWPALLQPAEAPGGGRQQVVAVVGKVSLPEINQLPGRAVRQLRKAASELVWRQ